MHKQTLVIDHFKSGVVIIILQQHSDVLLQLGKSCVGVFVLMALYKQGVGGVRCLLRQRGAASDPLGGVNDPLGRFPPIILIFLPFNKELVDKTGTNSWMFVCF